MRTRNKKKYQKPTAVSTPKPVHPAPEEREPAPHHFAVVHRYTVTIDPGKIDEHLALVSFGPNWSEDEVKEHLQEERIRFTRMLTAIQANKEALHAIMEHEVLSEHGSEGMYYVEPRKENDEYENFEDVLLSHAHCLHPQDREWLKNLFERHREIKDEEDRWDIGTQLTALHDCFEVTLDEWDIEQFQYVCGDCGHRH